MLSTGWSQSCSFWQLFNISTAKSTNQTAKSTNQTNISTSQTNISTSQTNISTFQTALLSHSQLLKTTPVLLPPLAVGRTVGRLSLSALICWSQTVNSNDQPLKTSALKPPTNQTLQTKEQLPAIQPCQHFKLPPTNISTIQTDNKSTYQTFNISTPHSHSLPRPSPRRCEQTPQRVRYGQPLHPVVRQVYIWMGLSRRRCAQRPEWSAGAYGSAGPPLYAHIASSV